MTDRKYKSLTPAQQRLVLEQQLLSFEEQHFRVTIDVRALGEDSPLDEATRRQMLDQRKAELARLEHSLKTIEHELSELPEAEKD